MTADVVETERSGNRRRTAESGPAGGCRAG